MENFGAPSTTPSPSTLLRRAHMFNSRRFQGAFRSPSRRYRRMEAKSGSVLNFPRRVRRSYRHRVGAVAYAGATRDLQAVSGSGPRATESDRGN